MTKAGATPEVLVQATQPFGLAQDHDNVYWSDEATKSVYKIGKASGATAVTLGTVSEVPTRVAIDEKDLYFLTIGLPATATDDLPRVPKEGGSVSEVYRGTSGPAITRRRLPRQAN